WWCGRLWSDLCLGRRPPFCAGCRPMRLDGGAVDGRRRVDAAETRQGLEHVLPYALSAPAIEAIVDRRVRPVLHRAIAPTRTRLKHVDNPGDHTAIIHPSGPAPATWQMRLDLRPRLVVQPVKLAHPEAPFRKP